MKKYTRFTSCQLIYLAHRRKSHKRLSCPLELRERWQSVSRESRRQLFETKSLVTLKLDEERSLYKFPGGDVDLDAVADGRVDVTASAAATGRAATAHDHLLRVGPLLDECIPIRLRALRLAAPRRRQTTTGRGRRRRRSLNAGEVYEGDVDHLSGLHLDQPRTAGSAAARFVTFRRDEAGDTAPVGGLHASVTVLVALQATGVLSWSRTHRQRHTYIREQNIGLGWMCLMWCIVRVSTITFGSTHRGFKSRATHHI